MILYSQLEYRLPKKTIKSEWLAVKDTFIKLSLPFLFVFLILGATMNPSQKPVVALYQPKVHEVDVLILSQKHIEPLKTVPTINPVVYTAAAVHEVPVVIAAPQPITLGCVTGYSTSNYALNQIMAHESGGRSCATNAGDCFGLLQACPGAPLRNACGGDPACQIAWFTANKTNGRSWEAIWALWQVQGWW